MSYVSGFCEHPTSHRYCRQFFAAYGATEATECTCKCHTLDALIERVGGRLAAAEILEVFASD